jgi:hypothetical protein
MNKLVAAICCVLIVGAGFIVWQAQRAEATASARGTDGTPAVTDTDDADSKRQLLEIRIHIAQTMWQYDILERLTFYKSCLKFDEQNGEFGIPPCKQLDNAVLLEMRRQIDSYANQIQK